jgi:hypothetical protein
VASGLARLIPETPPEIETLLSSLQFDFQQMEAQLKQQQNAEQAALPVPFSCMVSTADYPLIEQALGSMKQPDKGAALVALCNEVMNRHE